MNLLTDITNPLKGGGENILDILALLANFIFNLGVPVAVIIIIISGVRMLVSGGNSKKYMDGVNGLKWSTIGLGVLLIGKGFFSLIKTFLGGD